MEKATFLLIFTFSWVKINPKIVRQQCERCTQQTLEDTIEYTKVTQEDPTMQALAKASGFPVKEIVAAENQRRYRIAYNKQKQAKDKVMRAFFREHPEMLNGGKQ